MPAADPFVLPELFTRLILEGVWPSVSGPSMTAQDIRPLVPPERVKLFASDERVICLASPPFRTLKEEIAGEGAGSFWDEFGALSEIHPEKAVMIGDFGIGSDSPIILDFAANPTEPPVLRLKWDENRRTTWVMGARTFAEFAEMLALVPTTARRS